MESGSLEEMAVDHSEFAERLRWMGRGVTRRSALAAVAAGVWLGRDATGSEATRKGKRRKARKRTSASLPRLRPISIWVQNPGPNPVTLAHGDGRGCCYVLNPAVTVQPFSKVAVSSGYNTDTDHTWGFVWTNERYWISFHNTWLQRPDLTAALDGQPNNDWCCLPDPLGTVVVNARPMSVGDLTSFRLAEHSIWVSREPDTNYIVFKIILPATL